MLRLLSDGRQQPLGLAVVRLIGSNGFSAVWGLQLAVRPLRSLITDNCSLFTQQLLTVNYLLLTVN